MKNALKSGNSERARVQSRALALTPTNYSELETEGSTRREQGAVQATVLRERLARVEALRSNLNSVKEYRATKPAPRPTFSSEDATERMSARDYAYKIEAEWRLENGVSLGDPKVMEYARKNPEFQFERLEHPSEHLHLLREGVPHDYKVYIARKTRDDHTYNMAIKRLSAETGLETSELRTMYPSLNYQAKQQQKQSDRNYREDERYAEEQANLAEKNKKTLGSRFRALFTKKGKK